MINAKQVFFWTSTFKGHGFRGNTLSVHVWTTLFSWNRSCTSKVMAIYMYDTENVEFKFSRLRRDLDIWI